MRKKWDGGEENGDYLDQEMMNERNVGIILATNHSMGVFLQSGLKFATDTTPAGLTAGREIYEAVHNVIHVSFNMRVS
jgi:hypothetical protein